MPQLFDALRDLSELALGIRDCRLASERDAATFLPETSARMGGLVYLWSDSMALHVGVLATPGACGVLAGRLLGKPEGASLSHLVVRGAMCELAYLLAGGVKRRLRSAGAVSVGQPCFLEGTIQPRLGWQVEATDVQLDHTPATLVCMTRSASATLSP